MKKMIISLTIGLLLGSVSTVFAENIGQKVEAIYTSFKFEVNGEEKTIDALPIVINGKSYLPVTEIGNMLGYDVTYKADSRTIVFTSSNGYSLQGELAGESMNELERLENELSSINQKIEQLEQSKALFEENMENLKSEVYRLGGTEEDLENDLFYQKLKNNIESIETELSEKKELKQTIEKQIEELRQQEITN